MAMDDFHLESPGDIDMSGNLDQVLAGDSPSSWLSFGKDGNRAAMVQNDAAMGNLNLSMEINQDGIRSIGDRYYLNRNFLLMPQASPSAPQKIRFFIPQSEVSQLMTKDLSLNGFRQLGVFRYHGANQIGRAHV